MYGTPKKSIVESVIDPTTTKDVVSNLKFSVGESIKVEGVFDGKVELYQHYTNTKIVLLKDLMKHDIANKLVMRQVNMFDKDLNPVSSDVYFIFDADKKQVNVQTAEFVKSERIAHDASYFKLSKYGIPELDDSPIPEPRPFLYYVGIGVALVLAGCFAYLLYAKYRKE